ncbi:gas vesicle protein [Streptomyces glomeratus]|uniref:Gas vesicle protein n=1 Tax=Streptomyces glomeratus TaxID=284452 RepID=A0ABP6M329_9ACTN|nr:gas vesicle protein [Streptomyces glomeratus]MCF1508864.1 gas vesicle protein [Streptomyces glomeratus]
MSEYDTYDDRPVSQPQVALIDLLDRLLSGGAVLTGDLVLSIADIDLVRISLRAVMVAVREELDEQWATLLPSGPALTGRDGPGDEPV